MTPRLAGPLAGFLAGLALAAAAGSAAGAAAAPAAPFAGWAAIIVAGDNRAHDGSPSEGFDNARRDLATAFVAAGFSPEHIRQFSVRPERYADTRPMLSELIHITAELARLTAKAPEGCLVYFTSHGSPQGALVGEEVLSPKLANYILAATCADRPTVVVISACYSGVFVPALQAANRLVLTAARPDRSSFGCGETDKYSYFDACVLESIPGSSDFAALGRNAQGCVARREKAENLSPASEPQMAIGGDMRPLLPLYPFAKVPVAMTAESGMAARCAAVPKRPSGSAEAACKRSRP